MSEVEHVSYLVDGMDKDRGLVRLIEVEKHDLLDLPEIVEQIARRPERFIIFCDDLSFDGVYGKWRIAPVHQAPIDPQFRVLNRVAWQAGSKLQINSARF